jgi:predicted Zn-dependent protease
VLTERTSRPVAVDVVLDTDGVNAFAAPGGYVHITRGALALIKSEAELAGVLGHEIAHVTEKHTVNAIRKSKGVQIGTGETLSNRGMFLDALANRAYDMVLENSFDRGDELDADKEGILLVQKAARGHRSRSSGSTRRPEQGDGGRTACLRRIPKPGRINR